MKARQLSNYLLDLGMQYREVYNYRRLPKRAYRWTFDQRPSLRTIPPMSLVEFNTPDYCLIND